MTDTPRTTRADLGGPAEPPAKPTKSRSRAKTPTTSEVTTRLGPTDPGRTSSEAETDRPAAEATARATPKAARRAAPAKPRPSTKAAAAKSSAAPARPDASTTAVPAAADPTGNPTTVTTTEDRASTTATATSSATAAAWVGWHLSDSALDDHREQFVRAYLRHRVGAKLGAFERGGRRYAVAKRWTTGLTVLLYTAAAAAGAVAVADPGRRALWGFLATVAAALATAVAAYEAAFSFRAQARRSASGAAVLNLLQAHGAPSGTGGVAAFRTEVESVLRHSD
ncbi:hypothetical protein GCM10022243_45840 [Saccharothrix violaceirubra]|uniref:SMODS and SLOG-associating 2TM effector domain-containing protein n=1 Tax=Saccharothrix violaceirubra TaxID=413306 RepID=A0A7W7T1G4_9PSEU|nr:hypothetical protein [Saccharothrix violaceirubra]MBB4964526.1 hypothetical protein [Saccharothrix violaceirubra]